MLFAWQPFPLLAWQSNTATPGVAPAASQRQAFDLQHKTADQAASLLAPLLPPGSSVQWIIVPSSRRLEVIGPAEVLGQIAKMLPMIDRPAVARDGREPSKMELPEVRTYMAAPAPLRDLAQWTQQHLAPQGAALVVDSTSGQLIVRAPASLHHQIRQRLQDLTSPPSSRITDQLLPGTTPPLATSDVAQASWPPASGASANEPLGQTNAIEMAVGSHGAAPADAATAPWIQTSLPMPADRWPLLQRDLARLFGDRWRVQEGGRSAALSDARGNQIALHWDPSRQMLLWSCPASSATQLQRLILEASRSTVAGPTTAQQRVVRGSIDSASAIQAIVDQTRSIASGDLLPSSRNQNVSLVQPANYQDTPASAPPAETAPSNPEEKGEQAPSSGTRGSQFEGVQIETLPELDAMILRGRNEELDQLAEIIKQLEQVGEGTRPEIAVVPLEHANAARVATIITATQDDLTGGLQGRAFATPLVKPNAILLIGWG
jgi:type II secretory pathway component GspD/PulD (secretin)